MDEELSDPIPPDSLKEEAPSEQFDFRVKPNGLIVVLTGSSNVRVSWNDCKSRENDCSFGGVVSLTYVST